MPGRQAKIISPSMLRKMLAHVRHSRTPARDRVIILLSIKAGLRAAEIAQLDWLMVLDPQGRVGHLIFVHDAIAKKRSGRRTPMHPHLRRAPPVLLVHACDASGPGTRPPAGTPPLRTASRIGLRRTRRLTLSTKAGPALRRPWHFHYHRGAQSSPRRLQPA